MRIYVVDIAMYVRCGYYVRCRYVCTVRICVHAWRHARVWIRDNGVVDMRGVDICEWCGYVGGMRIWVHGMYMCALCVYM